MASLPSASQLTNALTTASSLTQQVGAFTPLAQISSVVQTLQNIQGFNAGAFSQLSGTIQSALQGFDQASNLLSSFSGNSPLSAFTNALSATGLAGSSISQIAGSAANAFQAADSFLSSVGVAQSFAKLSSGRSSVESSRETSKVGAMLQFPQDVGKYWIALGFVKYSYMKSGVPVQMKPRQSIILPVPSNLADNNQLQYDRFSLTEAAGQMASGAAQGAMNALGAVSAVGGAANLLSKMSPGLAGSIGALAGALGTGIETAGVMTGLAMNTMQSLKFVQPNMKEHMFQWKLIPSNEKESKALYNIIKSIKYHIYPYNRGIVYGYPDLVNVYLYNQDKMFVFKPAFVKSFSVNYAPDGGPAFYKSGYPFAVTITMQIQENSVWTREQIT